MKQAHQTSLRGGLKIEGIQLLHVPLSVCAVPTLCSHLYPVVFFLSLTFICRGLLFFFIRHPSELCWENGRTQQNIPSNSGFVVAVLLFPPSPFSAASIISKQLLLQPVPSPNHIRPITGQLYVWIWAALLTAPFANIAVPALCLSLSFCHSLSLSVSPPG